MKTRTLLFFICLVGTSFGQKLLSGYITNELNIPLAGAEIFVKSATDLRTVADAQGYYEMYLNPGEYYLVFTANGYQDRESFLGMADADTKRDMQLFPMRLTDVQDVRVSAKKTNVGRDKIMKVVEHREQLNQWSYPHEVDVYIKATEQRENTAKPKKENESRSSPPCSATPRRKPRCPRPPTSSRGSKSWACRRPATP